MEDKIKDIITSKLFSRYFVVFLIVVWVILFVLLFFCNLPEGNKEIADLLFGGYTSMAGKLIHDVVDRT